MSPMTRPPPPPPHVLLSVRAYRVLSVNTYRELDISADLARWESCARMHDLTTRSQGLVLTAAAALTSLSPTPRPPIMGFLDGFEIAFVSRVHLYVLGENGAGERK